MKTGFICILVIAIILFAINAPAQDYKLRTAREKYNEVKTEALKLATDAQLAVVYNGSDLVLPGNAHNWQYFFISKSKNMVYQFQYEEDTRSISRINPIKGEPGINFHAGMNTLPDDWMDSDKAIEYSDLYGGSDYRKTHPSDSYHIDLRYLPAVKDGVNCFYSTAICEVSYAGDNEFVIPTDIVSGAFIDVAQTTARQFVANVDNVAKRNSSDAELIRIDGLHIKINGKIWGWDYIYKSLQEQRLFRMHVKGGKICRGPEVEPDEERDLNTPALPGYWLDSDSAILITEEKGGSQFRTNNLDWDINMHLQALECDIATWNIYYNSAAESISYDIFADGNSKIPHTSLVHYLSVKSSASKVFNDAQLVFVFGDEVDENGVANKWNYIFKSPSQEELVHFFATPNGTVCQKEDINVPVENNTLLQMEAFPEMWFESDTVMHTVEENGGLEFRQNNDDCNVNMYLERAGNSQRLYWHVVYNSPSNSKDFWMKATKTKSYTAHEYLHLADSAAVEISENAQLVFVRAGQVNSDGLSDAWIYVYETDNQQQFIEIWITDGKVIIPDNPIVVWLQPGMNPLPDNWMDSDSVLFVAEEMGGKTFRESVEVSHIEMNLHASSEIDYHWNIYYLADGIDGRHYVVSSNEDYTTNNWPKTFGGPGFDVGYCIRQAQDEGYIIAGVTSSFGGGKKDAWVIKLFENGMQEWNHTFGGPEDETAHSVHKTNGFKGYILASNTKSYGSGSNDAWLMKLRSNGSDKWAQIFGNSALNYNNDVYETIDTGYVFTGKTQLDDTSDFDVWLLKSDLSGNEQWSQTYGGSHDDIAYSLEKTSDEGFILVGSTASTGAGGLDVFLIRTDQNGNELWSKTYGGTADDIAYSIQNTSDGGFVCAGSTASSGEGGMDLWLIKTDNSGNEQWSRTFGGENDEVGKCVQQTSDGGFIVTGYTKSEGAGGKDLWIIKTDNLGNKEWAQAFGGENDDFGESVTQTIQGGFLAVGGTYSYGEGDCDLWLVKINGHGFLTQNNTINKPNNFDLLQNYPNPFSSKTTIEFLLDRSTKVGFYFYDLHGKLVNRIVEKYYDQGKYRITFNAEELPPGIYFYKLQTIDSFIVKKMVVL